MNNKPFYSKEFANYLAIVDGSLKPSLYNFKTDKNKLEKLIYENNTTEITMDKPGNEPGSAIDQIDFSLLGYKSKADANVSVVEEPKPNYIKLNISPQKTYYEDHILENLSSVSCPIVRNYILFIHDEYERIKIRILRSLDCMTDKKQISTYASININKINHMLRKIIQKMIILESHNDNHSKAHYYIYCSLKSRLVRCLLKFEELFASFISISVINTIHQLDPHQLMSPCIEESALQNRFPMLSQNSSHTHTNQAKMARYYSADEKPQDSQYSETSSQHQGKLPWLGKLNVLTTLFEDLNTIQFKDPDDNFKEKTYINVPVNDIINFLHQHFTDKNGNPFNKKTL